MKFVIQRVKNASVTIDNTLFSSIGKGLLIFFCAQNGDSEKDLDWYVNKILKLRIFEDEDGKMNLSVMDTKGEILVVSQFTLAANCKKGTRPSFEDALEPALAKELYQKFTEKIRTFCPSVKTGVFAANMQISLVNDGPVTIIL